MLATHFVAADLVYTTPTQYSSFVETLMQGEGDSPGVFTHYAHFKPSSIRVHAGQRVHRG